jgi:nucleoside-diphosphate-sugar epimerase
VQHHACDLLDPAAAAHLLAKTRPTHLLHLAWFATPGKFWTSVENVRWVEASLRLARAFHEVGGQRFVGAGSCAEYDWTAGTCDEKTTRLAPATLRCEQHAVQTVLGAWGAQSGVSTGWGRLFFLYGPHEHPERLVPSVIRALLAKREAACTLGTQVRDFQHVDDCAGALAALLESDVRGGVNIASGRAVTVAEVVRAVADQLGASGLLRLGARATSADDPPMITADVQRLRTEVGWTDRLDLARGIARTIEWWRHA